MMYKSYVSINMLQRNVKHAQHYHIEYVSWKVTALSKYANKKIAKELKLRKYYRKCNQENFLLR